MNMYQITLLEKDEIHLPQIEEIAKKNKAIINGTRTKDGIVLEMEFPTYEFMERFINEIKPLNLFEDTGV